MIFSRLLSIWTAGFSIGIGIVAVPGNVMAQRPVGTDVSSYQGSGINWTTVKSDGVSYAWTKATEGTYYHDADYATNEKNAAAAGVPIGSYHFARPGYDPNITGATSADTEASYYWSYASSNVKADGYRLMPMLDWEDTNATIAKGFTTTQLSQWMNEWCNDVSNYAKASGLVVRPVVYTGGWYSDPSSTYPGLNSTVTVWPGWFSDYPSCTGGSCGTTPSVYQNNSPSGVYPWASSSWAIWQWGDTNWSGGDSDVFNGNTAQFQSYFLVTTNVLNGSTLYWDPGAQKSSPGSGGAGNWNSSTSNWWFSGASDQTWPVIGSDAIFGGTAGTVTLTSSVSANAITFNTAGYVVAGTGQTLFLNGVKPIISVPAGSPTYINCVVGGSGYEVTGGGILVLENAANYCGGSASPEYVNGPNTTLVVSTDHDAGNDGVVLNLENGGIYQDNDTTSGDQFLLPGCSVALLSGGGIFDNASASLTMSNSISGTGSLTYTGGSGFTLTLTDTGNSYSGGTIINGPGILRANGAGTLGSTSAPLTVNGGTLDLGGAGHTAGVVTITGGTLKDGTLIGSSYSGQSGTVSAILAGSAAMTKSTTGTFSLSGANAYTGITTISDGLLQISADGNLGAVPGSAITNKLTISGGVSNGLRCTASFVLNANRGITVVGPGGGSIQATTGQTVTYTGIITGSGGFGTGSSSSLGYGTIVLSGANNYKGATTISAGTLRMGADGTLPAGTPLTIGADNNTGGGGILDLNGFSQTIGPLASSTGIGSVGSNTPTIKLTGALTILQTNINTTYAGEIIGSGSLTIGGSGTMSVLTLSGTNTYTGNTTLNAGTLALSGTGSISSSATISIAAGATFDISAIPSYSLSGSSALTASGASSAATIKGGTTVNLGSRPVLLTYDGSHPALTVSQGALSLNGNSFTVNGAQLPIGSYNIIQQASGNITSSGSYPVSGTAVGAPGTTAAISVSGGSVILTISDTTTTVVITGTTSLANGTFQLSFTGTPGSNYVIEATTSLNPPIVWLPLSTNMADTNGQVQYIDMDATNHLLRFYQISGPQN